MPSFTREGRTYDIIDGKAYDNLSGELWKPPTGGATPPPAQPPQQQWGRPQQAAYQPPTGVYGQQGGTPRTAPPPMQPPTLRATRPINDNAPEADAEALAGPDNPIPGGGNQGNQNYIQPPLPPRDANEDAQLLIQLTTSSPDGGQGWPVDKARQWLEYMKQNGLSPRSPDYYEKFLTWAGANFKGASTTSQSPPQPQPGTQPGTQPGGQQPPVIAPEGHDWEKWFAEMDAKNKALTDGPKGTTVQGNDPRFTPGRLINRPSQTQNSVALLLERLKNEKDPEKINQLVQSIQGLHTIPQQQYFNDNMAGVFDQANLIANQAGNRTNLPLSMPDASFQNGGVDSLNLLQTLARANPQQFNAGGVYSGGGGAGSNMDTILWNLLGMTPNASASQISGITSGLTGGGAPGLNAGAPVSNLYNAEARAYGLGVPSGVSGAKAPGSNINTGGMELDPISGNWVSTGNATERAAALRTPGSISSAKAPGSNIDDVETRAYALGTPEAVKADAPGSTIDQAASKAQELLKTGDYKAAAEAYKGDINESFAEQERQLEQSLAAENRSNSSYADEARTRLKNAKGRAMAMADLQALQTIGGENRANLGAASDVLNTQFGQNLSGKQFGLQAGATQSDIERANLAALLGAKQAEFGQGVTQQQLGMQAGGMQSDIERSNLAALLGAKQAEFGQQLAGQQFGLQAGGMQSDIARANLGALSGIQQAQFGQQMAGKEFDASQALARGGESRANAGLLSGLDTQSLQNALALQSAGQSNIMNREGMDLARRQAELERMMAQAGVNQNQMGNLANLFGMQTGEAQRQFGNRSQNLLTEENIQNQRIAAAQNPLSMLLSAIRGVNVAPQTIGQLQLPAQFAPQPSAGQMFGQALGGIASNIPNMFRFGG